MIKKILLCLLIFVQYNVFSQQQWRPIGANDTNQPAFYYINAQDLALDQNNVPYLAFSDQNNNLDGKITVRRFVNGLWENVGQPGFSDNTASSISFRFDNNYVPYVAYAQSGSCYVKKFDGNSWIAVGIVGSTGYDLTLLFDSANVPYLGGRFGSSDIAGVKKYNGTTWDNIGTGNASPIYVQHVSFCLDQNDIPYIAYSDDYLNNWKISVKKLNGTSWQAVGPINFSTGQARYIDLKTDNNNILYVAYENTNTFKKAIIQKYNGTAWTTVGTETTYTDGISNTQLLFDSSNNPIITYNAGATMAIKTFNSSLPTPAWIDIAPNYRSLFSSIAIDSNNTIYMGNRKVEKYDNVTSAWSVLGDIDLTGYESHQDSFMAVSGDNTIYIAYMDYTIPTIVVKKWNGTIWESVGASTLLADNTSVANITVAPDNVPYLLCAGVGGYTVKKLVNNAWINVGMPNFNPQSWYRTSIAVDNNNVVYVTGITLETSGLENNVNVWKNDQSSAYWSTTGMTGIAKLDTAYNVEIVIGNDNMPFILYLDSNSTGKLLVKKLNASGYGWDIIGDFASDVTAITPHLALNSQNVPYVSYHEGALYKSTVRKFNGTVWELVGQAQFLENVASTKIIIDQNDIPYISYFDGNQNSYGRITVKKFTGTAWQLVGSQGLSASPSSNGFTDAVLAFNPYNVPVIMCNTFGIYAKYFGDENALWSTETTDFVNLQSPASTTIIYNQTATIHAQALKTGVTEGAGQGTGINAWIGISTTNTNPSTWNTWIPATYNAAITGNNDEYTAAIGNTLTGGTYYYASRFQMNTGPYKYGGYSPTGGGEWNGLENVSGILTINCNTTAPQAQATQSFCNNATVASLQPDGTDIRWYISQTGNTILPLDTQLQNNTIYYAAKFDVCESTQRTAVTVTINSVNTPEADSAQVFCNSATVADLLPNDQTIQWYSEEIGGQPLNPEFSLINEAVYYAEKTVGDCHSPSRTGVTAMIITTPAPTGNSPQQFTNINPELPFYPVLSNLVINTVTGADVKYYANPEDAADGQNALSPDTQITADGTYYITQTIQGCESDPFVVTADIVLSNEQFNKDFFTWYPNPVKDKLSFTYTDTINFVTIYNTLGQQVIIKEINNNKGQVDMLSLSQGIYLIKVTAGNTSQTIKVIKE